MASKTKAKKAPAKVAKAAPKKKPAAKKPAVKKPAAKAPAPKKAAKPAKAAAKAPLAPLRPAIQIRPAFARNAAASQPATPVKPPKPMPEKELAFFKDLLLKLRDRIIDEISFLSRENLNRSQRESSGDLSSYSFHMADQGTDNFDREFAANLLSSEQDVLYEIDEAVRRIEGGTYGVCEATGQAIEKERLKVLPFARYCVAAQQEIERGKPRFRPFKRSSIQSMETTNS